MNKISLSKGRFTLVDDEDFEYLNQWKWHFDSRGYARRTAHIAGKVKSILLHRVIMNAPKDKEVDHINGDKLDNRRNNLRLCNKSQQQANRNAPISNKTGFKGVYFHKQSKTYRANIRVRGKGMVLGNFKTPEIAAKVYNQAAVKYFGQFARLNLEADNIQEIEEKGGA